MGFTDYLELKVLDHLFGGEAYEQPAIVWVALSTTEIEDDGTGITEPAAEDGYARVEIGNTPTDDEWEDAELAMGPDEYEIARKRNSEVLEFPEATGDWGEITHFALFDSAVGGNMLAYGELYQSVPVLEEQQRSFSEQDLVITLD